MSDVKWIKIVTNIFDDQKIKFIETMPNGDEIIVIWFKLICLAGKSNSAGFLMMTDKIAYTEEMLSSIFSRDIKLIHLAIDVFVQLDMIEVIDNKIYISNWEKHQNAEKLSDIKEQNRIRQARFKANKRLMLEESNAKSVTEPLLDRYSNATDIDIDIEKDKEIYKRHKYGSYKNVMLSDDDMEKLKEEFHDYQERIERLSEYIASTGKSYKSHLATIRAWSRKEKPSQEPVKKNKYL